MPHPPIIIPEVGKGRENDVIDTINACKKLGSDIESLEVETIIIVSPHGVVFRDAIALIKSNCIYGDLGSFGASDVKFNYEIDLELTEKIIDLSLKESVPVIGLDEGTALRYNIDLSLDHGAMVPLYYVDKKRKCKLVHITYGLLSPIELLKFGTVVKEAVNELGKNAVFIASGDLSHRLTKDGPYKYNSLGKRFDNELVNILYKGEIKEIFNLDREMVREAGECGLRSLYILSGALNSSKIKGNKLSYEGPLGVGYAVFNFEEESGNLYEEIISEREKKHKEKMKEGNIYTILARKNLDLYFNEGKLLTSDDLEDKRLKDEKKGVFVSLKINGELRGCIGTISPTTDSVGEEIIKNSLSAALNDPRFPPLTKDELMDVDISVDLLYPSESTDFEGLDPENYGVIVTSGIKRGLLLPNLEGVNTKEQQVEIAMDKASIEPGENYSLERFKVERFSEIEG